MSWDTSRQHSWKPADSRPVTDQKISNLRNQLVWRTDIVLTSPTRGQVGVVGRLELGAITGEVLADKTLAEELTPVPTPSLRIEYYLQEVDTGCLAACAQVE